jgi:P-type E1-E2 ATPase
MLNGSLVGYFTWRDELRPEAQRTLQSLRSKGFQMGIVSGDAQEAVDNCARFCGWDLFDYRVGDCDPFAKQRFVQSVQSLSKRRVIFIGDGINDALAQSCSSLAISLNPYAASTASLTLLRPDLELIGEAFRIGRMLRIQITLNLIAASVYNLLMIPWAMGFGLTVGLPLLSPRITSILMAISGISLMFSNLLTFAK